MSNLGECPDCGWQEVRTEWLPHVSLSTFQTPSDRS